MPDELIKLVKGRWTTKIALVITKLNLIPASILIYVISRIDIWSIERIQRFGEYLQIKFEKIILFTIIIIIIVALTDSLSGLYKGIRYIEYLQSVDINP